MNSGNLYLPGLPDLFFMEDALWLIMIGSLKIMMVAFMPSAIGTGK